MKYNKYIYMVAAAMLFSCSDEVLEPNRSGETGESNETEEILFSGSIEDDLVILDKEGCDGAKIAETRSTYANGEFTSWSANDMISISDGGLFYYQYKVTDYSGTNCNFEIAKGKNAFEKKEENKSYYVFYPAEAVDEWEMNGKVTARVYAEQDYTENQDGGAMGTYMASIAEVTKDADGNKKVHFSFKHVASVIEVDLSSFNSDDVGYPVAVSVMTNNHMAIAGKFDYNVGTKEFKVVNDDMTDYATSSQSDVVTVSNLPSNVTKVRMYVLPVQIEGGLTITVRTSNNEYFTKSTTTDVGQNTDAGFIVSGITAFEYVEEGQEKSEATACNPYYKLINFGAVTSNTKRNNYMATIPSNTYFSKISTMSAHNAAASNFSSMGGATSSFASKTQSFPIYGNTTSDKGLVNYFGVRAVDLRAPYLTSDTWGTISGGTVIGECKVSDLVERLPIFHGIAQTSYGMVGVVQDLATFVRNNPTEAITVMFNKENNISFGGNDNTQWMWYALNKLFEGKTLKYNSGNPIENTTFNMPVHVGFDEGLTLGDVRGKLIIMNRRPEDTYGGNTLTGYNLCPKANGIVGWKDNSKSLKCTFLNKSNQNGNVYAWVEDYYDSEYNFSIWGDNNSGVTNLKAPEFEKMVKKASASKASTEKDTYYFCYTAIAASTTSMTLDLSAIAEKMNPKANAIIDKYSGPLGYVFSDFIGDDDKEGHKLSKRVLYQNARYVYKGRTRCTHTGMEDTGAIINGNEYADNTPVYIKRK